MIRNWILVRLTTLIGLPFLSLPILSLQEDATSPKYQIKSAAEARKVEPSAESVAVNLQDRETLAALAERVPNLKVLHLNYFPNGALPEGSVSELKNFQNLESLTFRGDPVVTPDEIDTIGELVSLRELHLALP